MRNDNDAKKGRVIDRLGRLMATATTPTWWRRTTNRWVAAGALGLVVMAPAADALSGAPAPTASVIATAGAPAEPWAAEAAPRGDARTDAGTQQDSTRPDLARRLPKTSGKSTVPAKPKPVAGLSQEQMDNAAIIVQAGQKAGLPKRAYVIAVATAMQESKLLNLSNPTVPQSLKHKSQGVGYDHDSVGLFQQRPSSGWGSPKQLLDQEYAATKFYKGLNEVPGWDRKPLTAAAQAVQGSAFPGAYAKHEAKATQVVDALTR